MHYPFWYVPGLTSPMLIAIVATLHVFVSMFAVGGGIVLASGIRTSYGTGDRDLLNYLHRFTWFFILITVAYGAISGVGIWWTIGLASPLATSDLIHIFVFVWAQEYAAFIVEVVAAFILFYGWKRLDPRSHQQIACIYAGAAWLSLFFITPITSFMLRNSSHELQTGVFEAFFNAQALPQILARTGGSLLLAALYIFLHAAIIIPKDDTLRFRLSGVVSRWAMLGGALTILGGITWYIFSPPGAQAALAGAATLNILMALIFGLTAATVAIMYLGPYRNPGWINLGFALLLFPMGLAATGTGEFIREAVRKPYVVYNRVLSNNIWVHEVPSLQRAGYLESGVWTKIYLAEQFPQLIAADQVDEAKIATLPRDRRIELGRALFQYHCNQCHSEQGYSSISLITRGWNREMIYVTTLNLNRTHFFMPPWCGTPEEAGALADYVYQVARPYPAGLPAPSGGASR